MWELVKNEKERALLLSLYDSERGSFKRIAISVEKYGVELSRQGARKIFKRFEKKGITFKNSENNYTLNKKRVKIKLFSIEILKKMIFPSTFGFIIAVTITPLLKDLALYLLWGSLIVFFPQLFYTIYVILTTHETRLVYINPKSSTS